MRVHYDAYFLYFWFLKQVYSSKLDLIPADRKELQFDCKILHIYNMLLLPHNIYFDGLELIGTRRHAYDANILRKLAGTEK